MNSTTLSAMMGTYKKTVPLKEGVVGSPQVTLDFAPVDTAQKAFKDVVRREKFDVAELAIVTFLQAFEAGKGYVMLPFVMNGNFHHKSILCRADSAITPSGLRGKRVAMRAYSQTTPTWVRGILSDEYSVGLGDVQWLSQEEAHVAEYVEPAFVKRIESSLSLEDMLRAGEVDAIIAGGALASNGGIRSLIPQPAEAALAWHRRTGVVPINHVVTVRRDLAETQPEVVREIYRLLHASRDAAGEAPQDGTLDLQPSGFDALRASLEMIIRFAHEQQLIRKRFAVEELYGRVFDVLR